MKRILFLNDFSNKTESAKETTTYIIKEMEFTILILHTIEALKYK